jgi:hypothetical protein
MSYYVHTVKRGKLSETRGPFAYAKARAYGRIAATHGRHNRAITRGRRGRITRIYQRRTGKSLYANRVGFDPSPFLFMLTALHPSRSVPPGYNRTKHGRGLHGEAAQLYIYPSKDVFVLPDESELSGYRVPGGSADLDVSGSDARYWLTVHMSSDGRTWKRVYHAPAAGSEAGTFLELAPTPRPYIRETWYEKRDGQWRKQGSTTNWS